MRVSRKRLVLVLGLTLGFGGRAGAQSTEYRTAFVHPPRSPMIDSSPRHALPFASSMLLIQPQADFHDAYSFRITESYKIQNADNFFPVPRNQDFVRHRIPPATRSNMGARVTS